MRVMIVLVLMAAASPGSVLTAYQSNTDRENVTSRDNDEKTAGRGEPTIQPTTLDRSVSYKTNNFVITRRAIQPHLKPLQNDKLNYHIWKKTVNYTHSGETTELPAGFDSNELDFVDSGENTEKGLVDFLNTQLKNNQKIVAILNGSIAGDNDIIKLNLLDRLADNRRKNASVSQMIQGGDSYDSNGENVAIDLTENVLDDSKNRSTSKSNEGIARENAVKDEQKSNLQEKTVDAAREFLRIVREDGDSNEKLGEVVENTLDRLYGEIREAEESQNKQQTTQYYLRKMLVDFCHKLKSLSDDFRNTKQLKLIVEGELDAFLQQKASVITKSGEKIVEIIKESLIKLNNKLDETPEEASQLLDNWLQETLAGVSRVGTDQELSMANKIEDLRRLVEYLRILNISCTDQDRNGHPASILESVDGSCNMTASLTTNVSAFNLGKQKSMVCEGEIETGFYYQGESSGQFKMSEGDTMANCKEICISDANCQAFSYFKQDKTCDMKTSVDLAQRVCNTNAVSMLIYRKDCPCEVERLRHTEFNATSVHRRGSIENVDEASCKKACMILPDCVGYTVNRYSTCYLHGQIFGAKKIVGSDSVSGRIDRICEKNHNNGTQI